MQIWATKFYGMLEMWLQPFPDTFESKTDKDHDTWRNQTGCFKKGTTRLESGQLAIFGVHQAVADPVRQALGSMNFPFDGLKICDLNAARNGGHEGIFPIFHDLVSSDIVPMALSGDEPFLYTAFMALHEKQDLVNMLMIDDRVPLLHADRARATGLHRVLDEERRFVFNLTMMGYQRHLSSAVDIRMLDEADFQHVRLGEARRDLAACEPLIRDADVLHINLRAVKFADAPAVFNPSTSGFTSEEICQLAYYAGMSDKLSVLVISGYKPEDDVRLQTANTLAQMIWYFTEGYHNRKGDYPVSGEHMTEYVVYFKDFDFNVHFWKSNRSGRWWIEWALPGSEEDARSRHQMIPCSYEDYRMACNQELPDRLFNMRNKFL